MFLRRTSIRLWMLSGAKYDSDQRYQSITGQCEELIQSNNQLQRTIKDLELRNQQLETNKTQVKPSLIISDMNVLI